jgi:hypothetical protein
MIRNRVTARCPRTVHGPPAGPNAVIARLPGRGFWSRIRRQSLFSLVNGVLSELKDDGRKAIYLTQQGRELRKRMLPPDPGPILSAP